ncbi:dynamin-related protein [Basidiobolus meristosporus CBS 931.73]|uniref:Dynamin-related protein n=1 Tax=Basidiobolus meristosporus CBS 931.73 TaxID=1314790 RepID=A0A1Y1XND6_9FUNG|nr:dynamin-related protein [Basidiobolus meristosporus CBS 931.73]|eukprot:ORX87270.1 dynamin-related protein [Basidiobolus meristosporus CBS 931.73]
MNDLIPLVNKLQDVFNTVGNDQLDLPQIVVVGSQSSGKSSVLENIVGRDFLPRGSGIVTRRPLVFQLVNLPENSLIQEYAEFLHIPDKRFSDLTEVRDEIEKETLRVAGTNKGISRIPIHLKIYSTKVLNLTLVDLPGLTKIPVGDQPTDIEKQTRQLILEYITKPNSIILAVSPANVDIVNSESLKAAREVDPDGTRTVGVLTKIDLMDAGTNALDILAGRVIHLRLGFIGVVNRSQQDNVTNTTISKALEKESEFFKSHPAYRSIADKCGTGYLAKTLNHILVKHIREKLPDMKAKLNSLIGQTQQELNTYGDASLSQTVNQGAFVLSLLTKFSTGFISSIDGTSPEFTTSELSGGARIYYIFNTILGTALDSISPGGNLSLQDIRTAIRNSTGPRPSLFVPEIAFELLVKPQIKRLEAPSLRCVELAYEELIKMCHHSTNKEFRKYPKLYSKIIEVVSDLLRERLEPTTRYVESLISIEMAYINTNHPDFIGGSGALAVLEKKLKQKKRDQEMLKRNHASPVTPVVNTSKEEKEVEETSTTENARFLKYFFGNNKGNGQASSPKGVVNEMIMPEKLHNNYPTPTSEKPLTPTSDDDESKDFSEREEMETQLIRSLITSYFNIVRKSIQDRIPKTIMHLLVNYTRENIQNRLVSELYKQEAFSELLQEDENIVAEREKCKTMLDVYRKAFAIISEAI